MLDNYCYSAQKEAISAISLKNFEKNVFFCTERGRSAHTKAVFAKFRGSGGDEGIIFPFQSIYVHVMSGTKGSPKFGVLTSSLTKIPQKSEILGIG